MVFSFNINEIRCISPSREMSIRTLRPMRFLRTRLRRAERKYVTPMVRAQSFGDIWLQAS